MFDSIENVPEYLCEQCDNCTYFELGYCPYILEERETDV